MTAQPHLPGRANALLVEQGSDYTARHLLVLEGLEAVRKRPGMYIGSTDSRGLMHCVWEIIDNSVDEALGGPGSSIEVVVRDDGRWRCATTAAGSRSIWSRRQGLRRRGGLDQAPRRREVRWRLVRRDRRSARGRGQRRQRVVGPPRCRGRSRRRHTRHELPPRQSGLFAGDGARRQVHRKVGSHEDQTHRQEDHRTRVRFYPTVRCSPKTPCRPRRLVKRARQTAFLVPGLEHHRRDERSSKGHEPSEQSFRYAGGIADFVDFLAPDAGITDTLRLVGSGAFDETVPMLDDLGHMTATEVQRELDVDIALRWGTEYETVLRSFVNIIATPKGGTHVVGFERALVKVMNEQLRSTKLLKVNDDAVIKEDILEGMTAVVTVRFAEPQFEGQTKEVLGTPAASKIVAEVVGRELKAFLSARSEATSSTRERCWRRSLRRRRRGSRRVHTRRRNDARTRLNPRHCQPSWPIAAAKTSIALSCSSSRAIRRWAPRSWRARASSRRCCPCAARSSTCRRPRSATC